jgi:hypothetical protein
LSSGTLSATSFSNCVDDIVYELMTTLVVGEVVSTLVVRNTDPATINNVVCREVSYSNRDRFVYVVSGTIGKVEGNQVRSIVDE